MSSREEMEEHRVKNLYRQAKHKVSKLVHTAKCQCCTEEMALASSSKELR